MFEPKQGLIPGYTGHQKTVEEVDSQTKNKVACKMIPGKFYQSVNNLTVSNLACVFKLKAMPVTFQESPARMYMVKPMERQAMHLQLRRSQEALTPQLMKNSTLV